MWGLRPVQTRAAGAGQCGTAGGHFGHGPILTMAPAPGIRTVVGWVVGMLVSFFERGPIDTCQGLTSDVSLVASDSAGAGDTVRQAAMRPLAQSMQFQRLTRLGLGG